MAMPKLHFYYSAMNAGKSTTLLQSSYNYHERGMGTILFCPAFDDRFGCPAVSSRIGLSEKAVLFDGKFDFFRYCEALVSNSAEQPPKKKLCRTPSSFDNCKYNCTTPAEKEACDKNNLRCVLVDEAQFLTKEQVAQLVLITKKLGLAVLCYGLRSDFLGEPFPGSMYLLAWAEELQEIKTICHCGAKATMNMRVDGDGKPAKAGKQVDVGGNEKYISVCMKHFNDYVGSIEGFSTAAEVADGSKAGA